MPRVLDHELILHAFKNMLDQTGVIKGKSICLEFVQLPTISALHLGEIQLNWGKIWPVRVVEHQLYVDTPMIYPYFYKYI